MKGDRGSKDGSSATPQRRPGEFKDSEPKIPRRAFPVNRSAYSLIFARKYDLAPPQFETGLEHVIFKLHRANHRDTLESFSDTFATLLA
jgi:hypothetical protein